MADVITTTETKMKGFKVFKPDFSCKGLQYEVGQEMEYTGTLEVGRRGLHFRSSAKGAFQHYHFDPLNRVAEVEALGEVAGDGDMKCTTKLLIVRELTWEEVLAIAKAEAENKEEEEEVSNEEN